MLFYAYLTTHEYVSKSYTLLTTPNKIIHLEQLKNYSVLLFVLWCQTNIYNEGCGGIGFQIIVRVTANFTLGVIYLFDNNYVVNTGSMAPNMPFINTLFSTIMFRAYKTNENI